MDSVRRTIAVVVWWVALALFVGSVLALGSALPDKVATHFGSSGDADGWMSRSGHLTSFLLLGIGLNLFVVGLFTMIRFLPSSMLNVPKKGFWRSPAGYPVACRFLLTHAFWLGTVLALWLACMNYFIVQANRVTPPRLDSGAMALLGGGLLAALLGWVVRMLIFFNHPHADL